LKLNLRSIILKFSSYFLARIELMTRLLTTLFLVTYGLSTLAQDYHQWSEHFGTRASLLGGAATSGLGDNATVYYNAAAMAFVENPHLSITVNAYKIRMAKIANALGDGLDVKETQVATFPSLIAGIVTPKKKNRFKFGYSINTKTAYSSKYDYLHQENYDILDSLVGPENYVASYSYNHSISEYWAGIGVSYQITNAIAIGLAHYGIFRDVKYSNFIEMSALPMDPSNGDIANVNSAIDFKYWTVKGVFKPSIAFSWPKSKLGITYTLPSFNILGKANVYRQFSIINLDENLATDITFVDRRVKQKAQHKTFGSLAIGVSKKLGTKSWLHFTNELFFGSPYYLLFNPNNPVNTYPNYINDSMTLEVFGNQNFLAYGERYLPMVNFGIGFERQINSKTEILIGARTDFNYNAQPYYIFQHLTIEASKWNLYHFSLGVSKLTKKNKMLTAGLEYTMTPHRKFHQFVNFTEPSSASLLVGDRHPVAYSVQHGFKIIIGIEIGEKKEDTTVSP